MISEKARQIFSERMGEGGDPEVIFLEDENRTSPRGEIERR